MLTHALGCNVLGLVGFGVHVLYQMVILLIAEYLVLQHCLYSTTKKQSKFIIISMLKKIR